MPVRADAGRRVDQGLAVDQRHEMADVSVGSTVVPTRLNGAT